MNSQLIQPSIMRELGRVENRAYNLIFNSLVGASQ